jgi:hypothetical protein
LASHAKALSPLRSASAVHDADNKSTLTVSPLFIFENTNKKTARTTNGSGGW